MSSRRWLRDAIHPEGGSSTQLTPQNRRSGNKKKEVSDSDREVLRRAALYAHALRKNKLKLEAAFADARAKFSVKKHDLENEYANIRNTGYPIPPLEWFEQTPDFAVISEQRSKEEYWEEQYIMNLSGEDLDREAAPLVAGRLTASYLVPFTTTGRDLRDFIRSSLLREPTDKWMELDAKLKTPTIQRATIDALMQRILKTVEQVCVKELRAALELADGNDSHQNA